MPPPNITYETAVEVSSLPFTASVNVHDSGTTYPVWYKYTAIANDSMIFAFGFGGTVNVGYQPYCIVYGPDSPVTQLIGGGNNRAIQFEVTAGSIYYLKFNPNNVTISPAVIDIEMERFVSSEYFEGDIFVPDDSEGFPATIFSSVDGTIKKYISPFPAGEAGNVLDDGTMMVSDSSGDPKIYNADFTLRATAVGVYNPTNAGISGNRVDTFYSATAGPAGAAPKVYKVTKDGVVTTQADNFTFPSGGFMGPGTVNPDETIFYYKPTAGDDAYKILKHDLVNDVALGTFVEQPTGYRPGTREILCLADGTVIVCYFAESGTPRNDHKIIRYNTDGSIANTYNSPGGHYINFNFIRMAYAVDDPTSFWVWYDEWETPPASGTTGRAIFLNIRVSDGTVLNTVYTYEYEMGAYEGPQIADPEPFGHSQSCPFLILRIDENPPEPEPADKSGIYFINPTKAGKSDKFYDRDNPGATVEVKLPNPIIRTALFGE